MLAAAALAVALTLAVKLWYKYTNIEKKTRWKLKWQQTKTSLKRKCNKFIRKITWKAIFHFPPSSFKSCHEENETKILFSLSFRQSRKNQIKFQFNEFQTWKKSHLKMWKCLKTSKIIIFPSFIFLTIFFFFNIF